MAVATSTIYTDPDYVIDVAGTNVDSGDVDYTAERNQADFNKGFSIVTGTLTNMTVKVFLYNKDGAAKDMTTDLFGAAVLASDKVYLADIPVPIKGIIIRYSRSNAVNAINFTALFAKR
jgi:hypothetical protein